MNNKRASKYDLEEEEIRKLIITADRQGMEIETIAEEVGYHPKSVQRIVREFKGKHDFKRRKGAGRPKKLSRSEKIAIRNSISTTPWLTCSELRTNLALKVCDETIRLYLQDQGYRFKQPVRKPRLTQKDKEARFNWALEHKNHDFTNVVFADETSFWLHSYTKKMWIKQGQEYHVGTLAHPDKVHVWGYITKEGEFSIKMFQENLTAERLIEIYKEGLTRGLNKRYGKGGWVLAHDNDPKHRAEKTIDYLTKQQVITTNNY